MDIRTLFRFAGLLAAAGCSGETTDDDTGVPWSGFDPVWVAWDFQFGFDADELVGVELPEGTVDPSFDLYLGLEGWEDEGFDRARDDLSCVVSFELSGSVPGWVSDDPSLWFGAEHGGGTATGSCDDTDHALDPSIWGEDAIATLVAAGVWGGAVGDLSPDAASQLEGASPSTRAVTFGGILRSPLLPDDVSATVLARSAAFVAGTHQVAIGVDDQPQWRDAGEVRGAPIVSGWYEAEDFLAYPLVPVR